MKKVSVFILLFIALGLKLQAQSDLVDTELWTGISAKMKLNKKVKIELEEQFRFKDSVQTFKSSLTEFGIRYKFNKKFSLKVNYRHSYRAGYRQRNRNRFSLFLYYDWDKKKFPVSVQLRSGIQNDFEVYNGQLLTYTRGRIKVKYKDLKDSKPFVAYESFYRFNAKNEFRTHRFTAGLGWDLTENLELTGFYRVEQEINVDEPERQHVVGFMFSYSFKY